MRLPGDLGESVRDELARLGGAPPGAGGIGEIVAAWPGAVGDVVARNAWPARVSRDGTLVVHASSSTWAFELSQLERSVREKLGELAPPRMRFVVGPLPERGAETVPEVQRSNPGPGRAERDRAARLTREIEHSELRDLISRAAAASLSRGRRTSASADASDTLRDG